MAPHLSHFSTKPDMKEFGCGEWEWEWEKTLGRNVAIQKKGSQFVVFRVGNFEF